MKNKRENYPGFYLELSKLKIMVPVSLTGFTGFFIYEPGFSLKIFLVTLAILFLSIAASVLNQIQETDLDRKMARTHDRPLAAKKLRLSDAALFSFVNLAAGMTILYCAGNFKAASAGLFTIFWYNVIYTYSKRITAFAVVPGALTGALPPLIGWLAAGGGLWDRPVIFLEFLFFTGQIPHFWLLIIKYGKEYENAGIPSLTRIFNERQISRLTFIWMVTSVIASLFLCYFEIIRNGIIGGILIAVSAIIVWQFSDLLRETAGTPKPGRFSVLIYSYYMLIMILLITDRLIA